MKTIGRTRYVHVREIDPLHPDMPLGWSREVEHSFNVVKYGPNTTSWLRYRGWWTRHEPVLVEYTTFNHTTGRWTHRTYKHGPVLHHKWMILDDPMYSEESKVRSEAIFAAKDGGRLDSRRMGQYAYWHEWLHNQSWSPWHRVSDEFRGYYSE